MTVNAVSVDGRFVPLTVTDRLTAEPPAFGVALAHVWPSRHDTAAAAVAAGAAVEAVGIRNGPSYTQLRLGPAGPVVMEVAARLGGGHDAELCAAATGVDLNALAVSFALGDDMSETDMSSCLAPRRVTKRQGAAVVFLVPPAGRLSRSRASRRRRRCPESMGARLPPAGSRLRAAAARRRPRRGRARHGGRPRRRAGAGAPCGGRRTLPGRCGRVVAPRSASSRPRSARRRSPPSPRRCARGG